MRSFCINPADGVGGPSWTDRLDAGPPPSWRHNLFTSKPISKKHSDSVQSEKKKNMIFFIIIILFVMVIIMYNVKFPLFYFVRFFWSFFFWKSVLSLSVNKESRPRLLVWPPHSDTVEHLWLGSTHTHTCTNTITNTHTHTFNMKRL